MKSWADLSRRAELAEALKQVAWKSIVDIFRDPSGDADPVFLILVEALQELEKPKWNSYDHTGALKKAVADAIFLLPHHEGPLGPAMSWQEIGYTLYGYKNVEAAKAINTAKTWNRFRKVVLNRLHVSDSKLHRDVLKYIFVMLAANLASLRPPSKERRGSMSFAETSILALMLAPGGRSTNLFVPQEKIKVLESLERKDRTAREILFAATYAQRLTSHPPVEMFIWAYVAIARPRTSRQTFVQALDRLQDCGFLETAISDRDFLHDSLDYALKNFHEPNPDGSYDLDKRLKVEPTVHQLLSVRYAPRSMEFADVLGKILDPFEGLSRLERCGADLMYVPMVALACLRSFLREFPKNELKRIRDEIREAQKNGRSPGWIWRRSVDHRLVWLHEVDALNWGSPLERHCLTIYGHEAMKWWTD